MIDKKVYVRNLMLRLSKEDAEGSRAYMRGLMSGGEPTIARNVQSLILWKLAVRTDQIQHEIY